MIPIYWGIFFEKSDILTGTLPNQINNPHVTYGYKAEYPIEKLQGVPVTVDLIGYDNDRVNEAYLVRIPEWTKEFYTDSGAEQPHITISLSDIGRVVDSGVLVFRPITPIQIRGHFGYFDKNGVHID